MTLDSGWKELFEEENKKPYFKELLAFLEQEPSSGKQIYPPSDEVFNAFTLTPFSKVKVVILGQDPYHGLGQAHGLAFSVKPGVKVPPSLRNIYKELNTDLGLRMPETGNLTEWAKRGVLLLNSVLTVEDSKPGSHAERGWEIFTDRVINELASKSNSLVFLLWGSHAQKKALCVDTEKHLILKAPHPSPLSAHRGFLGCKHFSKTNEYLLQSGLEPIDWWV